MRLVAAVLISLVVVIPGLAWPATDDIRGYCARLHQSYSLRLVCEQREVEAQQRVSRAYGLPYGIPVEIYNYCATLHESWALTEVCSQRELRAKERLGSGGGAVSKDCRRFFCD